MKALNWDVVYTALVFSLVGIVILLGGSSYAPVQNELVMRLWSIPVLCWSIYRIASSKIDNQSGFILVLLMIIPILIGVQLIVVPIETWKMLPGRAIWEMDLNALGITQMARPISMSPDSTVEALFQYIPIAALGLAALCLPDKHRNWVLLTFLAFGFLSLVFGAFQYSSSTPTIFDYQSSGSKKGETAGFFANKNHWALFLVGMIPIAGAALASGAKPSGTKTSGTKTSGTQKATLPIRLLAGAGFLAILAGVGVSASRSGLVLLASALVLCAAVWLVSRKNRRGAMLSFVMTAFAAIALLILVFLTNGLRALDRFTSDIGEDARLQIWEVTARASSKYFPLGAGGGSFVNVFKSEETLSELSRGYANQAHNEYLQIVLEYGVPGLVVLGFAVIGFLACAWSRIRLPSVQGQTGTQIDVQLGYLMVFLALCSLHSIVDFPLRAPTLGAMFVFIFVMVATPPLLPLKRTSAHKS